MKLSRGYILVTGANGFIGSHLVDALIKKGTHIVAIDKHNSPQKNLENSSSNPLFSYFKCDISKDTNLLEELTKKSSYIYHLGAIVGVQNYLKNPLDMFETNIIGSYNLAKTALGNNIPIMFASTSEIYGKNPNVPWKETADRILGSTEKDRWSYSSGKALIEHLLISLGKDQNFTYNIVRFFNVYGPRQKPIFVVSRAISRALRDLPVEMFDSGKQTRSYIYISDAVEAMIAIQENKSTEKIFNIGNEKEISVQELYSKIKLILPSMSIKNTSTELSHGVGYEDLLRRVPDNSRLINNTNWRSKISIETGLEKTINWASENKWWLNLNSEKE